ncbi:nitrate reductase molybdenum cofactor assembly chaperone [Rhizobium sp. 2YAF20]|uniref:nitrate reductase molybdenum cofactor assembly chaperone n=1 Tax=Rhizobium sp. 2YAF20 TaxID=3233027 RepID=UPI003F97AB29
MARTYRALAALLSYPTEALQAAMSEIAQVLADDGIIAAPQLPAICAFLNEMAAADIYDLQERYVALFDRSRTLSLHLFEHIHGESRDRGQAMADLITLYQQHGLEMAIDELPDFLPLFLEFLSLLPEAEARTMLTEPAGILRALTDRLAARNTGYMTVMAALADIAAAPMMAMSDIPEEDPDDLEAMDAAWEEAAVSFGPGEAVDACGAERLRNQIRAGQRDARQNPDCSAPSRDTAAA